MTEQKNLAWHFHPARQVDDIKPHGLRRHATGWPRRVGTATGCQYRHCCSARSTFATPRSKVASRTQHFRQNADSFSWVSAMRVPFACPPSAAIRKAA
jgi:hypothetical protein